MIVLNRCRQPQGLAGSPVVARFATRGARLYCVGLGLTAACGLVYLALRGIVVLLDVWPGDALQQHYFAFCVSVLSALLIRYYFDHFLFLRIDGVITPREQSAAHTAQAAPAMVPAAGARAGGVAARPAAALRS